MWRDQLRQASFKGIEFFVEDHDAEVGRRLSINEYPFRDEPYTEDLGRSARRYNVNGYVIGDNYITQRNLILDAVEAGGAGTLVHPYLGSKNVICESARLRETQSEGGFAIISMVFVEAGKKQFPNSSPVSVDLVEIKSNTLIDTIKTNFVNGMTVVGVSEWIRDSYSGTLGDVANVLETIRSNGGINNQSSTDLVNQAAEWVADVVDLKNAPDSLILDLEGTADKIISTFRGIFDLSSSNDKAINNLQEFSSFSPETINGTSAQANIANTNSATSQSFVRTVSIAVEANALVSKDFTSYEQAVNERKSILERIDDLAGETTDDDVYDSLRDLRAEIAQAVPGNSNELPRISNVSLKDSLPSLVLAYDIYEDLDKETDIINRNNVRHPGFLPGGQNLSVLTDANDRA